MGRAQSAIYSSINVKSILSLSAIHVISISLSMLNICNNLEIHIIDDALCCGTNQSKERRLEILGGDRGCSFK